MYSSKSKAVAEVLEEIKQCVTSTTKKTERFDTRIKQFRQNKQLKTNQR